MNLTYNKYDKNEIINEGDIIAIVLDTDTVTKASKLNNIVIGICNKDCTCNGTVVVKSQGICDVNCEGIICIGDKLTISDTPGKCVAIRYDKLEERQFGMKSIGKCIGFYTTYDRVKALLDIE